MPNWHEVTADEYEPKRKPTNFYNRGKIQSKNERHQRQRSYKKAALVK